MLLEPQASRVNAEAFTSRVARPVIEHVAEVAAAFSARYLGALHAEASIIVHDHAAGNSIVEARPASARVELGVRREQLIAAGSAGIHARLLGMHVLARERCLSPLLAQHVVLLWGQL